MLMLISIFIAILLFVAGSLLLLTKGRKQDDVLSERISSLVVEEGVDSEKERPAQRQLVLDSDSASGILQKLTRNSHPGRFISTLLIHGAMAVNVERILLVILACFLITLVGGLLLSIPWWMAVIVAIVAAYLPVGWLQYRKMRRLQSFSAALPESLEMCARSLRAGYSIIGAIGVIGEQGPEAVRAEFQEVFRKQSFGLPLRDGLLQMLDRVPLADLRGAVTGILVQKDTGGNLAEIVDRLARITRERVRIEREVRVHTTQGRLTGWILFLLPIFIGLLLNLLNPGYSKVLFVDPLGKKLLLGGCGLLLCGGLCIRSIVKGVEV